MIAQMVFEGIRTRVEFHRFTVCLTSEPRIRKNSMAPSVVCLEVIYVLAVDILTNDLCSVYMSVQVSEGLSLTDWP